MKLISDLVFRVALLVLVAPALPVTYQVGDLFQHVSDELEMVRLGR